MINPSSLPPTIASTTTNTESNLNILSDKSPSYNNTSLKLNYPNLSNNSSNSNNHYNMNTMNTMNSNDSLKFNKVKNFQQSPQPPQTQQKRASNSSSHLSSANAVKFFKDEIEKELRSNDNVSLQIWKMFNNKNTILPNNKRILNLSWRLNSIDSIKRKSSGSFSSSSSYSSALYSNSASPSSITSLPLNSKITKFNFNKNKRKSSTAFKSSLTSSNNPEFDYIEHIRRISREEYNEHGNNFNSNNNNNNNNNAILNDTSFIDSNFPNLTSSNPMEIDNPNFRKDSFTDSIFSPETNSLNSNTNSVFSQQLAPNTNSTNNNSTYNQNQSNHNNSNRFDLYNNSNNTTTNFNANNNTGNGTNNNSIANANNNNNNNNNQHHNIMANFGEDVIFGLNSVQDLDFNIDTFLKFDTNTDISAAASKAAPNSGNNTTSVAPVAAASQTSDNSAPAANSSKRDAAFGRVNGNGVADDTTNFQLSNYINSLEVSIEEETNRRNSNLTSEKTKSNSTTNNNNSNNSNNNNSIPTPASIYSSISGPSSTTSNSSTNQNNGTQNNNISIKQHNTLPNLNNNMNGDKR
ncbi:unnamed protein product [[Candida] boidinii]|nr:unnamed protein product [[Candida] boidinii]